MSTAMKRSCIGFCSSVIVPVFIMGTGCAPTSPPPLGLQHVEPGSDADPWDLDSVELQLRVRRVFYAEPVFVADGVGSATVTIEFFANPGPAFPIRADSGFAVAVGDQVFAPAPYSSKFAWHGRLKAPLITQDGAPITFGLYSGTGQAQLYEAQEEDTGLRYDSRSLVQYWMDEHATHD